MLASARTHLLSRISLSSTRSRSALQSFKVKPYRFRSQPITMAAPTGQIVEHFVLFNVMPETDSSKVEAMINGLSGLSSLDQVAHLTTGPILRDRSSSLAFTHMLHSRYRSKSDLREYAVHPDHLGMVKELVLPIVDDVMAFDWITDGLVGPVTLRPGSAARISLLKLKEDVGEEEKGGILKVISGVKDKIPSIEQISFGENFSDRAKGYSIGSIAVFPGVSELEGLYSNEDFVNEQKEKIGDLVESAVVVDYVVPQPQSTASL